MQNPPQDVSTIKYVYLETLSKEKAITEISEMNIEVTVSDKMVKFMPRYHIEYEEIESEDGDVYEQLKVYDVLYMEGDW